MFLILKYTNSSATGTCPCPVSQPTVAADCVEEAATATLRYEKAVCVMEKDCPGIDTKGITITASMQS